MKQRHSYTKLLYHIVCCTKRREHLILDVEHEQAINSFMKVKAHQLDAYIEEFGGWRDHIHFLVRARPTIALSDLYRQLKGFSAYSWRKQFPEDPFKWADGVFAATVDPDNCDDLRAYVRNQHKHHTENSLVAKWEPDEE
jgi:putative transposase